MSNSRQISVKVTLKRPVLAYKVGTTESVTLPAGTELTVYWEAKTHVVARSEVKLDWSGNVFTDYAIFTTLGQLLTD